jgi:hypothetical protein
MTKTKYETCVLWLVEGVLGERVKVDTRLLGPRSRREALSYWWEGLKVRAEIAWGKVRRKWGKG